MVKPERVTVTIDAALVEAAENAREAYRKAYKHRMPELGLYVDQRDDANAALAAAVINARGSGR